MSRNHEMVDVSDVTAAIGIYEWCMDRVQKVVVPVTEEGEMLNNVLRLFPDGSTTLSERQILQHLENALRADQVYKYLESLMKSGSLQKNAEGKYKRIFAKKGR
jgi:hypothetical protein